MTALRSSSFIRALPAVAAGAILCAAAFFTRPVPEAAAADPAVVFPAGTLAMFTIDGMPCSQVARDLALSRIYREPEVQEFLGEVIALADEKVTNLLENVAKDIGIPREDLVQLARSRLALGLTRLDLAALESGTGERPAIDVMIAIDSRGKHAALEAAVKALIAQASRGDPEFQRDATVGGHPAKEIAIEAFGSTLTYLLHEGWLIAATDAAQLEGALARVKSGDVAGSLAAQAAYVAGRGAVIRPYTAASFFFDVPALCAAFGTDPELARIIDALGLRTVTGVSWGMDLDGAGFRDRSLLGLAPNSPLAKLMPPGDVMGLLTRVPKNAFFAAACSLDLKAFLDYMRRAVIGIEPRSEDDVKQAFASIGEVLGPGWEEGLLPALGPEFAVFASMPEFGVTPQLGAWLRIKDRGQVDAVITRVSTEAQARGALRSLTFADTTIAYLDLGLLGIDDDVKFRPAWAFKDGHLLVAASPHTAKGILAGLADGDGGLPARDDFNRVLARLKADSAGAGNVSVAYVDARWIAGVLLDSLVPVFQSAVSRKDLDDLPLDPGKFPSTRAIVKHLSGFVAQTELRPEGLYQDSWSPAGRVAIGFLPGFLIPVWGLRASESVTGEPWEPPPPMPPEDEDR